MSLKTLLLAVGCLSIPLWADPVMVVAKINAEIDEKERQMLNEKDLFPINADEQLQVIQSNVTQIKVQNKTMHVDCINKEICAKSTPNKSFNFSPATVQRYDDNPEIIEISGVPQIDDTEIQLTRTFKDEITQNIDKETIGRILE